MISKHKEKFTEFLEDFTVSPESRNVGKSRVYRQVSKVSSDFAVFDFLQNTETTVFRDFAVTGKFPEISLFG